MKSTIIRTGFDTLYFTRLHTVLGRFFGGVGAILMLHHVRPQRQNAFAPNQGLEVSPAFLSHTVEWLRREGIDIVSLDEMHRRLTERDFRPPLRVPHLRRRLSRQQAMGLSDPQDP